MTIFKNLLKCDCIPSKSEQDKTKSRIVVLETQLHSMNRDVNLLKVKTETLSSLQTDINYMKHELKSIENKIDKIFDVLYKPKI